MGAVLSVCWQQEQRSQHQQQQHACCAFPATFLSSLRESRRPAAALLRASPASTPSLPFSTFCQAVKFEFYCESKSAVSNIIRGLVTGFLPSLLIILWQVGGCV